MGIHSLGVETTCIDLPCVDCAIIGGMPRRHQTFNFPNISGSIRFIFVSWTQARIGIEAILKFVAFCLTQYLAHWYIAVGAAANATSATPRK